MTNKPIPDRIYLQVVGEPVTRYVSKCLEWRDDPKHADTNDHITYVREDSKTSAESALTAIRVCLDSYFPGIKANSVYRCQEFLEPIQEILKAWEAKKNE